MTVYLLHFRNKRCHAQHYIGWTQNARTLAQRLSHHRSGNGSLYIRRVAAAVKADGGTFEFVLARVWKDGTKADETRLKGWHGSNQLCPICRREISYEEAQNGKYDV